MNKHKRLKGEGKMVENIDDYLEKENEMLELEEEKLEELVKNQLEADLHSPDIPEEVKKPEDIGLDSEIHKEFKPV